ncbi:MAG: CoA-binding protein [Caulobacterales bacterium]
MTEPPHEAKVRDFLAQKRIAVVGVSRDGARRSAASAIYRRLKGAGHEVFPVNPNLEAYEGDVCYPDLKAIPGGVDGVVVVTRPQVTDEIARQCGEAGVKRVWMHQSSASASSVSPAAVEYCRQAGISVIPGACPMMYGENVDFGHKCMRWMLKLSGGLPA